MVIKNKIIKIIVIFLILHFILVIIGELERKYWVKRQLEFINKLCKIYDLDCSGKIMSDDNFIEDLVQFKELRIFSKDRCRYIVIIPQCGCGMSRTSFRFLKNSLTYCSIYGGSYDFKYLKTMSGYPEIIDKKIFQERYYCTPEKYIEAWFWYVKQKKENKLTYISLDKARNYASDILDKFGKPKDAIFDKCIKDKSKESDAYICTWKRKDKESDKIEIKVLSLAGPYEGKLIKLEYKWD